MRARRSNADGRTISGGPGVALLSGLPGPNFVFGHMVFLGIFIGNRT